MRKIGSFNLMLVTIKLSPTSLGQTNLLYDERLVKLFGLLMNVMQILTVGTCSDRSDLSGGYPFGGTTRFPTIESTQHISSRDNPSFLDNF